MFQSTGLPSIFLRAQPWCALSNGHKCALGLDTRLGGQAKQLFLVKWSLAFPNSMLWTDAQRTTESLVCWMKLQTWQVELSHLRALPLAKSDGRIVAPATWWTEAWHLLMVERKVATRGFEGNSPRQSFSNAHTLALLLVRMQAGVFNCKNCSVSLQLGWIRPLSHKGAR